MATKSLEEASNLRVRPYRLPRAPLGAVAMFSLASNVLLLTLPLYLFQLFDRVITSGNLETLALLTIMATAALVVQALLDAIRGRILIRLGLAFERNLSRGMLLALIARSGRGEVGSAQSLRDLAEVRTFFTGNNLVTLLDAPWIPVYLAVIYFFHPALGAVAIAGAGVLLAIAGLNSVLVEPAVKAAGERAARSYQQADGYLRNAEAVRAMGMAQRLADRWHSAADGSIAAFARATDRIGTLSVVAKALRLFLQIAIMGLGVYLVLHKDATSGAMLAASILMARALAPIEMGITTWRSTSSAHAAWRRIKAFLAEAAAGASPMALPAPKGHLSVERANVVIPSRETPLLRGIGFALEAGEVLGVLGPSGAGKSTLCRALVGLQPVLPGSVRLDGADIRQWDPDRLGEHIGYLPQDVQLLAGTVRDNIARMRTGAVAEEVVLAAKRAGVHDMILRLPNGYDTEIGDGGGYLSGGERQRIALARALFGKPRLIVLDEPNAHLDVYGEDALVRATLDAKRRGATVVIITHRPSILKRADKLLVLRNGSIEHFGAAADVMHALRAPVGKPVPGEGSVPVAAPRPGPSVIARAGAALQGNR